jgi:hypothetical protein
MVVDGATALMLAPGLWLWLGNERKADPYPQLPCQAKHLDLRQD